MALKHVNAVIVGAGAGGGVAAKELAAGGLSVVLLERGKWYTAADCRKDDLRNQRTSALGNNSGPTRSVIRASWSTSTGRSVSCCPVKADTATTRRAWAAVR